MANVVSVTDLKRTTSALVDRVHESGDPIIITQNGRAKAVLVDMRKYDEDRRTIAMLKLVAHGEEEIRRGAVVPHAEVVRLFRPKAEAVTRSPVVAVLWTTEAIHDLEEAMAFVRADDEAAADRLELRILDAVGGLGSHGRRGRIVPELLRAGVREYRELVVAPYRIVYVPGARAHHVIAVLHGARDVEAVLHRRLTRPEGGSE